MKSKRIILITVILCLSLSLPRLLASDDPAIEFERFSERVLIVKSGKVYTDQVIAIASEKGIVMIDTGKAPSLTEKYRKIIEREFDRGDFSYVINTHYHFDHSDGNQVFPEAEIIAHELSPDLMRQFDLGRSNFIASRNAQFTQMLSQLEILDPDSEQALRLRDILQSNQVMVDDLQNNYVLTLPTITFNDRMTLDLGDITLKLIYFGQGRHTGDDIIIHCPEEKLLFTGDLFFKGSMQVAFSPQFDAPRWIEVLDYVLQDKSQVEFVFDTHNRRMPASFLVLWKDYFIDLWQGLNQAKQDGLDFEAVQSRFAYDEKFQHLVKSGIEEEQLRRDHQASLGFVWRNIHGMKSAMLELQETITNSGIETALEKFKEMYTLREDKYFFDETEFNRLGYLLIQRNQTLEAIEVFKLNVEMFPNSWNVYDSLGEGYLENGQTELAVKFYQKSLELNPQNTNAVSMLKRIAEMKE